jgi:hypothetical protein
VEIRPRHALYHELHLFRFDIFLDFADVKYRFPVDCCLDVVEDICIIIQEALTAFFVGNYIETDIALFRFGW